MVQNTCQKLFLFSWPYFFMNELASTFHGDVLFSNHKHKIVLNVPHLSLYTQRFPLLPLLIYVSWQEREGSVCLVFFFQLAGWFLLFPCICCGFTQSAKHSSKLQTRSLILVQDYCLFVEKKKKVPWHKLNNIWRPKKSIFLMKGRCMCSSYCHRTIFFIPTCSLTVSNVLFWFLQLSELY